MGPLVFVSKQHHLFTSLAFTPCECTVSLYSGAPTSAVSLSAVSVTLGQLQMILLCPIVGRSVTACHTITVPMSVTSLPLSTEAFTISHPYKKIV